MLRSAAVSLIQEDLGFTTQRSDSIIKRLQQAQRLLELGRTLPWFLLQEDEVLSITSGSADITLPTGFIREKDLEPDADEGPHYVDADTNEWVFLEKLNYSVGQQRFATTDAGPPQAYALRKGSIGVFPERDQAYTAYWTYYKNDSVLTSDIENDWLLYAPDALMGRAGMLIAEALRDQAAMQKFTSLYTQGWNAVLAENILRQEAQRPLYMGSRL